MEKLYTIEQFKKYLQKQDSFGDAMYNLTEEKIDKANTPMVYFCLDCEYEQSYTNE